MGWKPHGLTVVFENSFMQGILEFSRREREGSIFSPIHLIKMVLLKGTKIPIIELQV